MHTRTSLRQVLSISCTEAVAGESEGGYRAGNWRTAGTLDQASGIHIWPPRLTSWVTQDMSLVSRTSLPFRFLQVRPPHQKHEHLLGTCWKYRDSALTLDSLTPHYRLRFQAIPGHLKVWGVLLRLPVKIYHGFWDGGLQLSSKLISTRCAPPSQCSPCVLCPSWCSSRKELSSSCLCFIHVLAQMLPAQRGFLRPPPFLQQHFLVTLPLTFSCFTFFIALIFTYDLIIHQFTIYFDLF